ncbi:MAG TPA: ABATE domain-containing protein [Mesorhizobium sp.]|uniref:CGNR zinc finger domain-containing protein n=1 Tax=Mesorhizobium sp. TaxID=1871066 RepID=UPI002DDD7D1B|nr:ABATE domain-containing protein [Mesorhizobium sp.]HEV2506857.1 ABATE domain-containing protein [Mesorhizobium sp.]
MTAEPAWPHRFIAGTLCLDFVNTIDLTGTPKERDLIADYDALVGWSVARGTMPAATGEKLLRLARAAPSDAANVLADALALRGAIRQLAETAQANGDLSPLLPSINTYLAFLTFPPRLQKMRRAGEATYDLPGQNVVEPLWPILWTLSTLLVSEDLGRLGTCHAQDCRAIFIDHTNNRSRIWCASDLCGNRERVRRAYRARRVGTAPNNH